MEAKAEVDEKSIITRNIREQLIKILVVTSKKTERRMEEKTYKTRKHGKARQVNPYPVEMYNWQISSLPFIF